MILKNESGRRGRGIEDLIMRLYGTCIMNFMYAQEEPLRLLRMGAGLDLSGEVDALYCLSGPVELYSYVMTFLKNSRVTVTPGFGFLGLYNFLGGGVDNLICILRGLEKRGLVHSVNAPTFAEQLQFYLSDKGRALVRKRFESFLMN